MKNEVTRALAAKKHYLLALFVALTASLTMSAQYVVSDKYNLWFEDSGHEVTTRKLVWCTEDYQDLWNGCHVRLYNGRIHIKNGNSTVSTKTAIRSAESMVMTSHSLTTADGNAFEAVM